MSKLGNFRPRNISLKLRFGVGSALLALAAIMSAIIMFVGMGEVDKRLKTALASETRMARYSTLSTEVSTFLVIATEAVQTGLSPELRKDRIVPVARKLSEAFIHLHSDLEQAVGQAEALQLDQQARYGAQSLGLARMEAILGGTMADLTSDSEDQNRLRASLNSFASGFDPLLNQAVNTEVLFRNEILSGIEELRRRLVMWAIIIAVGSAMLILAFNLFLVRPQFLRLERLRVAAERIGQEDFELSLPSTNQDEIGRIFSATNKMAASLSARQDEVREEWDRLNETINHRTTELRAANKRLEEVDENRRRFFADVSHELRTPLTVILMEAQLGQKGAADPVEAFSTIENRADRLNRRIDDLLRVARSDSGQLSLNSQPTRLDEIAKEAIEEVAAEVESAGMNLTASCRGDVMVNCDPNWARQITVGLVRNAIRHARGGRYVRIVIVEDGERAGLMVLDNGPGVSSGALDGMFDRFAQSGENRSQGFGIGLALTRWVIQAQDGGVRAISPVPAEEALGDAPGLKIGFYLPKLIA